MAGGGGGGRGVGVGEGGEGQFFLEVHGNPLMSPLSANMVRSANASTVLIG